MIAPSNRLLFWTAAAIVPFAAVAAFTPSAQIIGPVIAALLCFIAACDVALSARSLTQLEMDAPEIIRLSKNVEDTVELEVCSPTRSFKAVRFGLMLPETIQAVSTDLYTEIPQPDRRYRLRWQIKPRECGKYHLPLCGMETASRLGLWIIRRRVPIQAELRVYPNLRRELRSTAALFLNRGDYGGHLWRQVSKGREFEKLREYIPGDTYRDIHWKTTAKRQHPVTKVYQIERTQEVYVIIDSSRLSARRIPQPDTDETVTLLERYATSALMLAMAAESQGDLFGLIEFGSKPHRFLKAARGKTHFDTCRNALYTLLPEGSSPDFNELISFIRTRLRKRALLVFLTSLDDAAEAERFKEHISLLSRHHLTVVNMMRPEGAAPLFNGDSVQSVPELYDRLGGHIAWRRLHELETHLQTSGVQFNLLSNEHLSSDLVSQYMHIKQRQLI